MRDITLIKEPKISEMKPNLIRKMLGNRPVWRSQMEFIPNCLDIRAMSRKLTHSLKEISTLDTLRF